MIDEKMMMLDLKLELNDSRILDIEMQVVDEGNWTERSLAYLCRAFDQLEKEENYLDVKETIHIGILNFTPKDFPEKLYLDYFFYNLDTASEAREDYYRRLNWAEERGLRKGMAWDNSGGLAGGEEAAGVKIFTNFYEVAFSHRDM